MITKFKSRKWFTMEDKPAYTIWFSNEKSKDPLHCLSILEEDLPILINYCKRLLERSDEKKAT